MVISNIYAQKANQNYKDESKVVFDNESFAIK